MNDWTDKSMGQYINKSINKPTNWKNRWMNEWINGWINEWMNHQMNEWLTESTNQLVSWLINQSINQSVNTWNWRVQHFTPFSNQILRSNLYKINHATSPEFPQKFSHCMICCLLFRSQGDHIGYCQCNLDNVCRQSVANPYFKEYPVNYSKDNYEYKNLWDYLQSFLVVSHDSIRGCVRPSVRPSVTSFFLADRNKDGERLLPCI